MAANLSGLDRQGVDTLAPTVTAVTDNSVPAVTNGPISFTATFSEAVRGVSTGSFTATNGTIASVTQVDSSHYTVVVNPAAGVASGNVALSLVAGGATDTAGNAAVAGGLSSPGKPGVDTPGATGGAGGPPVCAGTVDTAHFLNPVLTLGDVHTVSPPL